MMELLKIYFTINRLGWFMARYETLMAALPARWIFNVDHEA